MRLNWGREFIHGASFTPGNIIGPRTLWKVPGCSNLAPAPRYSCNPKRLVIFIHRYDIRERPITAAAPNDPSDSRSASKVDDSMSFLPTSPSPLRVSLLFQYFQSAVTVDQALSGPQTVHLGFAASRRVNAVEQAFGLLLPSCQSSISTSSSAILTVPVLHGFFYRSKVALGLVKNGTLCLYPAHLIIVLVNEINHGALPNHPTRACGAGREDIEPIRPWSSLAIWLVSNTSPSARSTKDCAILLLSFARDL